MHVEEAVLRVQTAYPMVYLACHTQRRTPRTTGQELTQRDSDILAHLSEREPMRQGELQRHLGIAKSTMSEALKWLEGQGYLRRAPAAGDSRGALVLRTGKGTQAVKRGSVLEPELLERLLLRLTSAQREQAVAGLELLAKAARESKGGKR